MHGSIDELVGAASEPQQHLRVTHLGHRGARGGLPHGYSVPDAITGTASRGAVSLHRRNVSLPDGRIPNLRLPVTDADGGPVTASTAAHAAAGSELLRPGRRVSGHVGLDSRRSGAGLPGELGREALFADLGSSNPAGAPLAAAAAAGAAGSSRRQSNNSRWLGAGGGREVELADLGHLGAAGVAAAGVGGGNVSIRALLRSPAGEMNDWATRQIAAAAGSGRVHGKSAEGSLYGSRGLRPTEEELLLLQQQQAERPLMAEELWGDAAAAAAAANNNDDDNEEQLDQEVEVLQHEPGGNALQYPLPPLSAAQQQQLRRPPPPQRHRLVPLYDSSSGRMYGSYPVTLAYPLADADAVDDDDADAADVMHLQAHGRPSYGGVPSRLAARLPPSTALEDQQQQQQRMRSTRHRTTDPYLRPAPRHSYHHQQQQQQLGGEVLLDAAGLHGD
ncbi:hypothetical protein Agub_g4107, partial [Astrephomene gubernaculifera]